MKKVTYIIVYLCFTVCCIQSSNTPSNAINDFENPKNAPSKSNQIVQLSMPKDTVFHPEKFHEEVQDTVLNKIDGIHLKLTRYPRMDKGRYELYEYENGIIEGVFFRDYVGHIELKIRENVVFDYQFEKEGFSEIEDEEFMKYAILHSLRLDNYDPKNGEVKIWCTVAVPDTDWLYLFEFKIDESGKIERKLLEIN